MSKGDLKNCLVLESEMGHLLFPRLTYTRHRDVSSKACSKSFIDSALDERGVKNAKSLQAGRSGESKNVKQEVSILPPR